MKKALYICNRGFSLMTVVFVMLAMAIAGTAVVSLISTSSHMLIDAHRAQQAFDLAQAGISYQAQDLVGDNDWNDNLGGTVNFGPGFFTTLFTDQTASTATVRSVGDVAGTTRTVEQRFTRGTPAAFVDAIYTEDRFHITGNSNIKVEGSVSTGGSVQISGNSNVDMDGPISEYDEDVSAPSIDWSYWKGASDHTILGNYQFSEGTHSGVYYISGKVDIKNLSNFTLDGSIVARGQVHISNTSNVTINASGTNPAIVSEGKMQINNNSNASILGWLFGLDKVHITSTSNFNCGGGIVAEGEIKCTGNSSFDVEYNPDLVPDIGFVGGEPGSGMGGSTIMYGGWAEKF